MSDIWSNRPVAGGELTPEALCAAAEAATAVYYPREVPCRPDDAQACDEYDRQALEIPICAECGHDEARHARPRWLARLDSGGAR